MNNTSTQKTTFPERYEATGLLSSGSSTARTLEKLLEKHRLLQRRYHLLKHGLDRAGRIQRSLLPLRTPAVTGYRFTHLYQPCEAVGGDFYDFVESSDELIVMVCDVVGHGFEAALATMLIKEVFKETVDETTEPLQLLLKMNRRLHRALPEGMFAATAILNLSSALTRLQFANAGLPYPFVLRAREHLVEQIDLAGFPLGLFAEVPIPFEVRSVRLLPGDVLLIGSDGIHTVAGEDGDFFEDERLPRLLSELVGLSGEDVIQRLADETLRFGNGQPLPDDLNLLAITRE